MPVCAPALASSPAQREARAPTAPPLNRPRVSSEFVPACRHPAARGFGADIPETPRSCKDAWCVVELPGGSTPRRFDVLASRIRTRLERGHCPRRRNPMTLTLLTVLAAAVLGGGLAAQITLIVAFAVGALVLIAVANGAG